MDGKTFRGFRNTVTLVLVTFLAACADGSVRIPISPEAQSREFPDVSVVPLTADNIAGFAATTLPAQTTVLPKSGKWTYRIGDGDLLNITVFDHTELATSTAEKPGAAASAVLVQADGTFFYPFVGKVRAAGLTAEEIRTALTERLTTYFPDPQVAVQIVEFNAQSIVVAGEVGAPRSVALSTKPLQLLEAINAAGGLTPLADTAHVTVQRGGTVYDVNLRAFLSEGLANNNPVLMAGDIVTVRRQVAQEAYIMGSVKSPSIVNLAVDPITLTQALARQGGLDEVRADARGVFVFRQAGARTTVYQLDVSSPGGWLIGNRFMLMSGDVIYVTRSPLSKWNDTISRLLPSVSAGKSVATTAR